MITVLIKEGGINVVTPHHTSSSNHSKMFPKIILKNKNYTKSPVLEMMLLIKMVSMKNQDLMHERFCCGEDFEHENGCSNLCL